MRVTALLTCLILAGAVNAQSAPPEQSSGSGEPVVSTYVPIGATAPAASLRRVAGEAGVPVPPSTPMSQTPAVPIPHTPAAGMPVLGVTDFGVPDIGVPGGLGAPGYGGSPGRFWVSGEYLNWRVQGDRLPALVTTGPTSLPAGTAGVFGAPGTAVVLGDDRVNDGWRSGVRLSAGLWLDDCRTCGVGVEGFRLADPGEGFLVQSNGSPALVRPVVNTLTGQADAEITAFPGLAVGGVSVATESQLCGAGAYAIKALCGGPGGCSLYALAGYRYLSLEERLTITEAVTSVDLTPGAPPVGTVFTLVDSYRTRNQFHGADVGLAGHWANGCFFADLIGKVAVGCNARDVEIGGTSRIAVPGLAPTVAAGGLYTIGAPASASDQVLSVVPEIRLNVGYQFGCVRVFGGYNLLCWTNVVRPGAQVDQAVNPNLLPPALGPIPPRSVPFQSETLWLHGWTVGLSVAF